MVNAAGSSSQTCEARRRSPGKDLDRKGFFGGFTFILHPVVQRETDTAGGKAELERLGDFAAMGRIALEGASGTVPNEPELKDPAIIECARSQTPSC